MLEYDAIICIGLFHQPKNSDCRWRIVGLCIDYETKVKLPQRKHAPYPTPKSTAGEQLRENHVEIYSTALAGWCNKNTCHKTKILRRYTFWKSFVAFICCEAQTTETVCSGNFVAPSLHIQTFLVKHNIPVDRQVAYTPNLALYNYCLSSSWKYFWKKPDPTPNKKLCMKSLLEMHCIRMYFKRELRF